MAKRIDPRYGNNLIDANVLDRGAGVEDAVVDRILDLVEGGQVSVMLPHSVKAEIEHPNTPADVKRRAAGLIFTEPVSLTPQEMYRHAKVRALLQGNARPGKHDKDAFHLFEAQKYGRIFITRDGRMLDKRAEIAQLVDVAIVSPREFLEAYDAGAADRK